VALSLVLQCVAKKKTDEKGKFGSANYVTQCSGQEDHSCYGGLGSPLSQRFFHLHEDDYCNDYFSLKPDLQRSTEIII
jgi:transketolase C-terminal domain/subunit